MAITKNDQTIGKYTRGRAPFNKDDTHLYVVQETQRVEQTISQLANAAIQVTDVSPVKPRKGMVRYAVSPWNPLGTGDGLCYWTGSAWSSLHLGGNVVGPSSSTDNEVPRFDLATGKLLQTSGILIDDSKNIQPITDAVGSLGTTANRWANAYLATGGVLNWNNGNIVITHSAGVLTMTGGTLVVSTSTSGSIPIELVCTDSGSGYGPDLSLYRDSASPAASDIIGTLTWYGRDSAANKQIYNRIYSTITDPANGSEDSQMVFESIVAGTNTDRLRLGAGLFTSGATGGDKGVDTINAKGYFASAGTASLAPLTFTSGTNLTTATAGAWEYDGKVFYATALASSRQVIATYQIICLTAAYTLTSQTAAQKLFNSPTNGALTVAANTTYRFRCMFSLTAMSATTGNGGFAFLGTATLTRQKWQAIAADAVALATAIAANISDNTAANVLLAPNAVNTTMDVQIEGIIRVGAAGTIIPAVSLTTAAAAIVGVDSFFEIWPVGADTVASVGNWS